MKFTHGVGHLAVVSILALCAGTASAAPVSWTGAGDGITWTNPANWSSNPALPGPADDVTINVAGTPSITLNANATIRSLNTAETLTITGLNRTLTISTTAVATANVTIDDGARISGGAWDVSAASLRVGNGQNSNSNAILGAVVTGDIVLPSNSSRVTIDVASSFTRIRMQGTSSGVFFQPGAVLNGEIRCEAASGTTSVELTSSGALTLAASGSIIMAPGAGGTFQVGPGFWIGSNITTFTVNGTISNQSANGTLLVDPATSVNAAGATLSATGGGLLDIRDLSGNVRGPSVSGTGSEVRLAGNYTLNTVTNVATGNVLTLSGTWANTSTINLSGTLNINGGNSAGFGTINRTGGSFAVTGTLDNVGRNIALNAATGDWTLAGGTISGGTVTCADGARIIASSVSSNNRLLNVAVSGDVVLNSTNSRVKIEGTTTFTNLRLAAADTSVGLGDGVVIIGNIIGEGASTSTRHVEMNGAVGTVTISNTGSIKTSAGMSGSLSIGPGFWYGANMTLINNGLIASDVATSAADEVIVNPGTSFTSTGTLRVAGGSSMSVSKLIGTVGTCTIQDTGSELTLDGTAYTLGTPITVPTGATLTLNGSWSNATTITLAGQLNAGGTVTTAGLGTINRTGGSVALSGTLNNTGSTLALSAATGNWVLNGTLSGGNVTFTDGATLLVSNTSGNARLLNVAVGGDVVLNTSNARLRVEGSTTFNNIRMAAASTAVGFAPGYTLVNTIVAEGAPTGSRNVEMNGTAGTFTVGATGVIKTATGLGGTFQVGGGFWFGGSMKLVNNGLISSEIAAKNLTVNPGTDYSGSGTLRAINSGDITLTKAAGSIGTLVLADSGSDIDITGTDYILPVKPTIPTGTSLSLDGTWSSTNSFNVSGGILNLNGTVTIAGLNLPAFQRSGGTVNLIGTLDNTGNTITFNGTTGSWTLLGGTISGGSIAYANGATLIFGNATSRLLNVNVLGDVTLNVTNARVKLEGTTRFVTARLQGQSVGVGFSPGYVLRDTIINEGPVSGTSSVELNGTAGTFTIDTTGSITSSPSATTTLQIGGSFWFGGSMTLVNNGVISHQATGRTMTINPATGFSGSGTINISTGTLNLSNANGSIGALNLSGNGTVANIDSTPAGTYSFAAKPVIPNGTTLKLSGNWSLPQGATLSGGTVNFDSPFTTTSLNLNQWTRSGGTINISSTLDNTGTTLALNSTTGPINLVGGAITGGSVTQTGTGQLTVSGDCFFTDVNVTPELSVATSNSRARMLGTSTSPLIRLTGQGSGVGFRTGTVLNTAVLCEGTGLRYVDAIPLTSSGPSTLTIGSSGSIISTGPAIHLSDTGGWQTSRMTFTNNGVVAIDSTSPSAYLFLSVTDVTNYDRASKTLTGGTWRLSGVNNGANVINEAVTVGPTTTYDPIVVTSNAANVTLASGTGFNTAFNTLTTNSGSLTLTGRTLATTPVGGTFTNSGTLTLTPSARFNIAGSYTQSPAGTYNAQIGGTQASGAFAQINATGAASLAGTLNATFTANRVCGNIYSILTSSNRTGTWSPANIPPSDVDTVVFLFYPDNNARLAVSTTADFNFDGFVTFEDFDDFVSAFENGEARADFNQDGFLSFEDFDAFIFRFEAACD